MLKCPSLPPKKKEKILLTYSYLSLSGSSFLDDDGVHSFKESNWFVTSSAHRQFTNSCMCKDALIKIRHDYFYMYIFNFEFT